MDYENFLPDGSGCLGRLGKIFFFGGILIIFLPSEIFGINTFSKVVIGIFLLLLGAIRIYLSNKN